MDVGDQAVQKKACPPHAIKFTTGGGTTKKQAVGSRIQIPPGRSLKGKPHTQKRKKKRKKTKTQLQENQPSQQPDTVRNSAAQLCCQHRFPIYPAVVLPPSGHRQETLRVGRKHTHAVLVSHYTPSSYVLVHPDFFTSA